MTTVLLSGASGFIGTALASSFTADGFRIARLVRSPGQAGVHWDPERGSVDSAALQALAPDLIVNLAGEPIAHRWTSERRRRIYDSRVKGTRALADAIAAMPRRPRAFVSGSAIGYYGRNRHDETLTEASLPGDDFLATTSRDWEQAAEPAATAGVRVAALRTGIVLGRDGGALARMLPPFLAGVGGPLASGRQWMSWISLTDTVRAIRFICEHATLSGAVNIVAPEPVRNSGFTSTLGSVLHRPAILPVPRFALTALFGEMAEHTILASQRVLPGKLTGAGFDFRHPQLDAALRYQLRR